jgi:hypothetical protein
MTLITEIRDRAACAAWSPLRSHPDWVTTGTKVSVCLRLRCALIVLCNCCDIYIVMYIIYISFCLQSVTFSLLFKFSLNLCHLFFYWMNESNRTLVELDFKILVENWRFMT